MKLKTTLVFLTALLIVSASARADLLLSPTRVFFGQRERTQKVILKNTSNETKSYRVFFKNLQMNDEGNYYEVDPSETPNYAGEMIRYSPRLITIEPQQTQTIRLFLRRKAGMDFPEYRSHLAFKEVPPEDFGNQISGEPGTQTVRLVTLFEITIPVIVKNGLENYNVTIDGLAVLRDQSSTRLNAVFNRNGDTSSYGDIVVKYKGESEETYRVVGRINRFFVYYPSNKRQIEIKLDLPAETVPQNGVLQIFYNRTQNDGGDLIAFSSLNLN